MSLPPPRLIVTPEYSGYYMTDINDALTQAQRALFAGWFDEQTGIFHNGRKLVYADDWEWFLALQRRQLADAEYDEA